VISFIGLAGMLVLLALGIPIFVSLGLISLVMIAGEGRPLIDAGLTAIGGLNSTAFVAVPFFVIAATFMQKGGIAKVLINAAHAWVGWARGGLALVCVFATTIFAAISGSSVATAMAMGTFLIPSMIEKGYDRPFALGVVGAAGTMGVLIPPSLAMILYGLIVEESVPRLFLAGVVPGLIQACLLSAWIIYAARRKGYEAGTRLSGNEFAKVNFRALPAFSIPIIVFIGIYGGYTTVAEAAGLAAILAAFIAVFIYRETPVSEIFEVITEGVKTASGITFIVIFALLFGHWITGSGVPTAIVEFAIAQDLQSWQFLLFVNLLMIVLGMFLDAIAVILIVVPVVLPVLDALQIDKIHFGIVMVVNMEIAFLTPPIGLNLFVLSSISRAPLTEAIKGVAPFIVLMIGFLMLITYVPEISLWLPNLVFGG
jgi:C4-dicarboxylate transporter, DctM subunit